MSHRALRGISTVFKWAAAITCHTIHMIQYPDQKHWFGARDATLHAAFSVVQGGGTEERRRGDEKLLPSAHASYRVLRGRVREVKRTQWQQIGDGMLVSPNVNVLHRTKRGKSQGISGRHRRLKKIFFE